MPSQGSSTVPFASQTKQTFVAPSNNAWIRLKTQLRLQFRWWFWQHRDFQPVFVIATYRSGSNLLLSYLNQQPDTTVLSEVLSPNLPIGLRRSQTAPQKAIRHIHLSLQGRRTAVRGCKLMLSQLADCRLTLDDINREFPHAKFIVLFRQSLAEQFLSHSVAAVTGEYLVPKGYHPQQAEVTVDPIELRAYCDEMRRSYRSALDRSWLASKAVLLSYEELAADPTRCLRDQLCPLLGVPFAPIETRLEKQNKRSFRERVVNYAEVAALLHSPLCRQEHDWPWRSAVRQAA